MSALFTRLRSLIGRRFPFAIVYSNAYWMFDMGKHIFPLEKYRLVYEGLLSMGAKKENVFQPDPAPEDNVLLVHSSRYLKKLKTGQLSPSEIATLELMFSPELVSFAFLSVGGTILAARKALEEGMALHVGGGFHHAFPDHGEGFCVLNDVAVAVETMLAEETIEKAMIVDCDLHQGNGTAAVFSKREEVYTFSIHQMDVYPANKPESTMDVELWSGDGDEKYLTELRARIPLIYEEFQPDFIFYLAGADPFEEDQLGGLTLTKAGLKERDRIVIEGARKLRVPLAIVLAGGYAPDVRDTVDIHLNTVRVAQRTERQYPRP